MLLVRLITAALLVGLTLGCQRESAANGGHSAALQPPTQPAPESHQPAAEPVAKPESTPAARPSQPDPPSSAPEKWMTTRDSINALGPIMASMPMEIRLTLPIPAVENGRAVIRRLYFLGRLVPGEGTYIAPPETVGIADYKKGKFIAMETVREQDVKSSLPFDPPPWMLKVKYPDPIEFGKHLERYCELVDILLPAYASSPPREGRKVREAAKEFIPLFEDLAEKPLLPYYDWLGGRFYNWTRRMAAGR